MISDHRKGLTYPSSNPARSMTLKTLRLSAGTAKVLSLREVRSDALPITGYIMAGDKCMNSCAFCAQSSALGGAGGNDLSRISWPPFPYDVVMDALKGARPKGLKRLCVQCLMDPPLLPELPSLVRDLKEASDLPLSLSISPHSTEFLKKLRGAGADRVGIALDAASPEIFERVKGAGVGNPHTYGSIKEALLRAVDIFGRNNVSTHIIIGLGETDSQVLDVLKWSKENGITLSLFALTPVRGGPDLGPPPPIGRYRALQAVRHLVMELGITEGFGTDGSGKLMTIPEISSLDQENWKTAFETRGCPDCNRPYYNERPGGTIFNYPIQLTKNQADRAFLEVEKYVSGS